MKTNDRNPDDTEKTGATVTSARNDGWEELAAREDCRTVLYRGMDMLRKANPTKDVEMYLRLDGLPAAVNAQALRRICSNMMRFFGVTPKLMLHHYMALNKFADEVLAAGSSHDEDPTGLGVFSSEYILEDFMEEVGEYVTYEVMEKGSACWNAGLIYVGNGDQLVLGEITSIDKTTYVMQVKSVRWGAETRWPIPGHKHYDASRLSQPGYLRPADVWDRLALGGSGSRSAMGLALDTLMRQKQWSNQRLSKESGVAEDTLIDIRIGSILKSTCVLPNILTALDVSAHKFEEYVQYVQKTLDSLEGVREP